MTIFWDGGGFQEKQKWPVEWIALLGNFDFRRASKSSSKAENKNCRSLMTSLARRHCLMGILYNSDDGRTQFSSFCPVLSFCYLEILKTFCTIPFLFITCKPKPTKCSGKATLVLTLSRFCCVSWIYFLLVHGMDIFFYFHGIERRNSAVLEGPLESSFPTEKTGASSLDLKAFLHCCRPCFWNGMFHPLLRKVHPTVTKGPIMGDCVTRSRTKC